MKGGPFFKKIIYSSWFLATTPAIIIMLFLPHLNPRYRLLIEPKGSLEGQSAYDDLNCDSISEFIMSGKGIPYYHLIIFGEDNRVYDQWNLQDNLNPDLSMFFTGNYDHDRFREIYVFTHKEDSLFLNINEFFEPAGTKMERIFISKIGYIKGELTSNADPAGFFDENGDGNDELYFTVNTGFGLEPRRLYSFDIENKKLKTGPFIGIMCLHPGMTDTDNDGKPEIFGKMSASGNQKTLVPYSDWSTWLMVFDEKLEFEFQPVEFPGFAGVLETEAFRGEGVNGYVLSHWVSGTDTTLPKSGISIYSIDGRFIRSHNYKDLGLTEYPYLFVTKHGNTDRIFVVSNKIIAFNENLDLLWSKEVPFKSAYYPYQADVNSDGNDEFLLYSEEEEGLEVFSSDFHKLAKVKFKAPDYRAEFSKYIPKGYPPKLFMYSGRKGYFLTLLKNNYYFLSFFAYPGIYLAFFVLIVLTKKITTYQVIQKESLKQRLITLQLQGIKSQLDPHFTFNTLNSVASLIYLEDREAAYDYMNKFTMLLRGMLNDAERIYRTLGEELEFVTTYLDLEKLRLGGKLNFDIKIGDGVNKLEKVPKLVLQTFAENAVKHGIMPSESGGLIRISVIKEKDYLKLTIEDNGIGRRQSAGNNNSTGKGLKLTNEFYEILNHINKKPIRHLITDLYNSSHEPSGTRVEVWVPADEFVNYVRT
jgi:hypothetical protein